MNQNRELLDVGCVKDFYFVQAQEPSSAGTNTYE